MQKKFLINAVKTNKRASFLIVLLLVFYGHLLAGSNFSSDYADNLKINNTGMMVLGTWAIANIATGAYGWSNYRGEKMYFHQMNLFWNVVNFSIAGIAIYGNYTFDYMQLPNEELLAKMLKTERILLINTALDFGYMTTGFLMRNFASGSEKRQQLLKGYGSSIILQGAFLLVFDLVLYGVLKTHRQSFSDALSISFIPEIKGLDFNFQF